MPQPARVGLRIFRQSPADGRVILQQLDARFAAGRNDKHRVRLHAAQAHDFFDPLAFEVRFLGFGETEHVAIKRQRPRHIGDDDVEVIDAENHAWGAG